MSNPKLVMIDEPSLGLAPKIVSEIFNILIELNKEGYTILLAEQNAKKALECGNRGYVIETSKVVLHGITQELMNNSKVRQAYLGSSV
jgi:branched-chain amino acid transport system ATP-binding protein